MANPITSIRLEESMSLNALAKRLGLSRQYISRAEQGTYTSLNPKLISWTAEKSELSKGEIVRRYVEFQIAMRKATAEEVSPQPLSRGNDTTSQGYEIFERWRSSYWPSTISFANAFCVHPETVKTYEEGIRPFLPEPLKKALSQVDLMDEKWFDAPKVKPQTAV